MYRTVWNRKTVALIALGVESGMRCRMHCACFFLATVLELCSNYGGSCG